MTPAVVVGLVVTPDEMLLILVGLTQLALGLFLGARVERWRHRRALGAAIAIVNRYAEENLARADRQDTDRPWRGQWVATPSAWAAFQEGREHPEAH